MHGTSLHGIEAQATLMSYYEDGHIQILRNIPTYHQTARCDIFNDHHQTRRR
jgi:hypothetical protein